MRAAVPTRVGRRGAACRPGPRRAGPRRAVAAGPRGLAARGGSIAGVCVSVGGPSPVHVRHDARVRPRRRSRPGAVASPRPDAEHGQLTSVVGSGPPHSRSGSCRHRDVSGSASGVGWASRDGAPAARATGRRARRRGMAWRDADGAAGTVSVTRAVVSSTRPRTDRREQARRDQGPITARGGRIVPGPLVRAPGLAPAARPCTPAPAGGPSATALPRLRPPRDAASRTRRTEYQTPARAARRAGPARSTARRRGRAGGARDQRDLGVRARCSGHLDVDDGGYAEQRLDPSAISVVTVNESPGSTCRVSRRRARPARCRTGP